VAHHRLKRLRVYGGFLDRLDVQFSDGLNCLIGGRGSGKTTVLEFLRFALDRLPKPTTPVGKAAEERLRGLIAANLGATGCVELEFESQEGLTYHIRRGTHEAPTITDARGKPVDPGVLGSSILIDAAIFSHNQIEEIAATPAAQRELIDRLCAQALHTLGAKLTQAVGSLRENAQRILQLEARRVSARQDLVETVGAAEALHPVATLGEVPHHALTGAGFGLAGADDLPVALALALLHLELVARVLQRSDLDADVVAVDLRAAPHRRRRRVRGGLRRCRKEQSGADGRGRSD